MAKSGPGPLSHSSAQTLLGCEQKYYFYKIEGAPRDPDYEKSDALAIGSAVHDILEHSRHEKPKSLARAVEKCIKDPDVLLPPEHANMVAAMVLKYCRLHKRMGERILEVEFKIKTESVIGFIDMILEDEDGKWWIGDVKTWGQMGFDKLPSAPNDPQLNLYAAHAPLIAEMFDLPLENFGGVRWRVVTKSKAKQRATESDVEFIKRLADKHLKAYDIPVPAKLLDPSRVLAQHEDLYQRTLDMAKDKNPFRNYGNCFSYFSPCEYWSRCHGGRCFSEGRDLISMTVES